MKYLCLIYWDEERLFAIPDREMHALNAEHLAFNERLRASGHMIEAEALQPSRETACVRVRDGKRSITDGPFAEAKELVAGFYLIEARDLDEANEIAAQIPSARYATVEVRPTRQLIVE